MNGMAGVIGAIFRHRQLFVDCDDYEASSNRFSAGWQQRVVKAFENRLPTYARLVTSNTQFTLNRLRSLGIPEKRLVYLPNGVDRKRFATPEQGKVNELRASLKLNGSQVIVYVGSLSLPSHPVDLLVEAFALLRHRLPNTRLLVVGGGEDLSVLKKQAETLNLADSIVFTGRVPSGDVPLYYCLGNVSVDPVYDTPAAAGRAPLKMFESWASGIPFVTQDVGDRQYLAGDPPAALLTRPGSPESFAEGMEQILRRPELAAELTDRGYQRVQDFFWDRIVERTAWIYQPPEEA
jgi:glycosyltransferase involved in cell wall biosynthesis